MKEKSIYNLRKLVFVFGVAFPIFIFAMESNKACPVILSFTDEQVDTYKIKEAAFLGNIRSNSEDPFSERQFRNFNDSMVTMRTTTRTGSPIIQNLQNGISMHVEIADIDESRELALQRQKNESQKLMQKLEAESRKSSFGLQAMSILKAMRFFGAVIPKAEPIQETLFNDYILQIGINGIERTIPFKRVNLKSYKSTRIRAPSMNPFVDRISNSGNTAVIVTKQNEYYNGIIERPSEVHVIQTSIKHVRTYTLQSPKATVLQTAFSPSESKLAIVFYENSSFNPQGFHLVVLDLHSTHLQVLYEAELPFKNLKDEWAYQEYMKPRLNFISEDTFVYASDNFTFSSVNIKTDERKPVLNILESGLVKYMSSSLSRYKYYPSQRFIFPSDFAVRSDLNQARILLGPAWIYAQNQTQGRDPQDWVTAELIYRIEPDGRMALTGERMVSTIFTERK